MREILLVEDDLILGESILELIEYENYKVTWVKDGNLALSETYNNTFDLYVFDIDIPYINGLELLDTLRKSGDETPCIFLTANIDIDSLSKGFDVGCDDYIKKPFDSDELIIRINKQIKKSFSSYKDILTYKDLKFNIQEKMLFQNDKKLHLSPILLMLFELFVKNINKQLTKEDILYHTHNGEEGSEAALRVQISKLKKLGLNITNQRSQGYKLEEI